MNKNKKIAILPAKFGAVCCFLNVNNFFIIISFVASLISKFYLNLRTVEFIFTNKVGFVAETSFIPLKATFLRGFFYCNNLANVNLN